MEDIRRVQLSEIAELITKGTTPTTLGYEFQEAGVNFLKIECFDENGGFIENKAAYISEECHEKLKRSQLKAGDVLFSIAGAIGRVAIVTEEMLPANTNQALAIIRISNEQVYLPYIKLILTSPIVIEQFERKKQGVAQLNLSLKDINEISIPLPNKDKQIELAELFDKVAGVIAKRKMEVSALDELIKARFVELFGKPIDNTMSWPIDKAENLCILVTDGSHFSPKACYEGYPMLSVKDMRQNGFDYSDCKLVDDETFEVLKKQGCIPQVNDVLIAKDGSYFTRAFAVTEYKDQAILSSIGMYRPDLNKILPRFLASYLMTNEVVEFVNRGYVTGTALRRVIIKGLKSIPVYMPPIALQKEFVEFCKQVDKSKVAVQKALDETQLLFDSLMQEYFG